MITCPFAATRDDRGSYIGTLKVADYGDLDPLAEFTSRLHRHSILYAMTRPATNDPRRTSR